MRDSARYIVRYGQMRYLGEFIDPRPIEYGRGEKVLLQTDRGTELGEILCRADDRSARYLETSTRGEILRKATRDDSRNAEALTAIQRDGYEACLRLIKERRLQMNLVDVEAILGGERLVFYYLADKRVDFRELVKDLARIFRTRIEMRQIGVRDEAKLLADYGDCGKPVCCNTHLSRMPPVSMRMAKLQKSTLDPSKISGRCGRLKCCLRYEFETYQDFEQKLPQAGSTILTEHGRGRVLAQEILAQRVLVELDDKRRILVSALELMGGSIAARSSRSRPDPGEVC